MKVATRGAPMHRGTAMCTNLRSCIRVPVSCRCYSCLQMVINGDAPALDGLQTYDVDVKSGPQHLVHSAQCEPRTRMAVELVALHRRPERRVQERHPGEVHDEQRDVLTEQPLEQLPHRWHSEKVGLASEPQDPTPRIRFFFT